ncbi:MAG: protein translocase subunit SecF, partial [Dermatophilaceae bacterium]|nr:protein translocase subunit SecF [Dermatophilaceae bacterium]
VRSINTTVVALLPIAAVLVVGFTLLGPGTLLDLSLALFIGIGVGAYSSIFIATPLLVDLRRNEPAVRQLDKYVARHGAKAAEAAEAAEISGGAGEPVAVGSDSTGAAAPAGLPDGAPRPVHKYAQAAGPRNQPKRAPKSRR